MSYGKSKLFEEGGYKLECVRWWCNSLCEWNWAYTLKNKENEKLMHISFGGDNTPTIDTLRKLVKTLEVLKKDV